MPSCCVGLVIAGKVIKTKVLLKMKLLCKFFWGCFLMPIICHAEKKPLGNGLYWELNNSVLSISGNGGPIHFIGSAPWKNNGPIDKVIIEEGVTSIGDMAFREFSTNYHIKSVVIPNSVKSIGALAFEYCSSLQTIILGNSVVSIDHHAFANCNNLQTIKLPNSVRYIGNFAFYGCKNLLKVSLPSFMSRIGRYAFMGCDKLIPDTNSKLLYIMKKRDYESIIGIDNNGNLFYIVDKHIINIGYRYGLINSEGKEIVPCEMEALESAGTGYLRYKINGFWGLMNYMGKILIGTERGYTSIGDFKTFNKRFPYTMAGYKGECDINGRQISKIKVDTPQQAVASSSSSFNSSSSSSSNSSSSNPGTTQTVVVEHHRDPVPVQEWQQCVACFGSGQCPNVSCGGSGWYYIGDRATTCSRCHGSGKCTICAGKGGQYITVYR